MTATVTSDEVVERVGHWWVGALVTGTATLFVTTSLRVLFPGTYGLTDRAGTTAAVGVAVTVGAAPFLAPLVRRVFGGARRAVVVLFGALAAWRVVVAIPEDKPLWLAIAGTVLAAVTLTLVLAAALPGGGDAKGVGLLAGVGIDAAVLGGFATWDPVWQRTGASGVAAVAFVGLAVGAALASRHHWAEPGSDPTGPTLGGATAIGLLLLFEVLFLANPAYLAATTGWSTSVAVVAAGIGAALAIGAHTAVGRGGFAPTVIAALVLALCGFLLVDADGAAAVALVAAAQLGVGSIVAWALAPARDAHPVASEVGFALGWFGFVVATLIFQLHYDSPLPVDNRVVPATVGLLLAAAAVGHHRRDTGRYPVRPALAAVALVLGASLLAGLRLAVTAPEPAVAVDADSVRLVQWNVRQAVDEDGQLDPAAVADAIRDAGPVDVVVLHEVGRGWPVSGQLDLADWLSRELGLPYVWAGAASDQFGNVVLSRLPITSSEVTALPVAGDAQGRSLLTAQLDAGDGRTLTLLATHLQHRNGAAPHATRLQEIGLILEGWDGEWRTILAGDLNPKQGDPPDYPPRVPQTFDEIAALLAAGFTTAADLDACSAPTSGRNCSDWVMTTPDLRQTSYTVVPVPGFDHRMIVTDITTG